MDSFGDISEVKEVKRKKYILAVSAAVLALILVSCTAKPGGSSNRSSADSKSDAVRDNSVIFIAVQPDSEPFEYIDSDGYYDGFDAALAMKICEELGRTPIFVSEYGEELYDSLNCGTAEMAVSSLVPSDKAKQKVDFTDEYITLSSAIVTNSYDSIITNEVSLKNAPSVGVISDSFSDRYITNTLGLDNIIRYRNFDDAKDSFLRGECYALFVDEYLAGQLEQGDSGIIVRQRGIGEEKYAIAAAKGNTELVRTINEKISRFKTDGTLLNLRLAYLAGDTELRELFKNEVKAIQK